MSTPANGSRLEFVDALRGFAILLVVFGHALQFGTNAPDENFFYRIVYTFHMPLFMFISGFVHSGFKRSLRNEVRVKSVSLLVPFLAWLPINFVWMQFATPTPPSIVDFVSRVARAPDDGGLWFLLILYFINILLVASRWVSRNRTLQIACGLWLLLNIVLRIFPASNVLGLGLLSWHMPFFLIGMLARKGLEGKDVTALSVFVACAIYIVLFPMWVRVGPGPISTFNLPPSLVPPLVKILNYVVALSAIWVAFSSFRESGRRNPLTRPLSWIGRISLEIYATHLYFLMPALYVVSVASLSELVRVMVASAAGLVGALFAIAAIKRVPFLARLLFGNRDREKSELRLTGA